jgi:hypothetical protein
LDTAPKLEFIRATDFDRAMGATGNSRTENSARVGSRVSPPRLIAKASSGIFFPGQYGNVVRVVAFNTAEGWSWDVCEDIAREILQRAIAAGENLGEDTKRFIDRHVADATLPGPNPVQTSPVDLIDRLKPDFEKRPAEPSMWRKAIPAAGRKRS